MYPRAKAGTLSLTWVGHSTWLLQLGMLNVLTDPMWSDRASPFSFMGPKRWAAPGLPLDELPPIDVVLQSHSHYDHLDSRTVRAIARAHPEARWFCPLGVGALVKKWGVESSTELDWWDRVSLDATCEVEIGCTPARHFSARSPFDRNRTLWCGFTIRDGSRSAYFAGDTAMHPDFGAIRDRFGPFDVAMIPIGAYEPRWFMRAVHMNPEEAVEAYRALRREGEATSFVGMHWGTFKLTDEPLLEPPRLTRELWAASRLPNDALWIFAHGETRHI
jgi:N-acyl-phosphatidylethanolamine-hydrolysing phospholipase D